MQVRVQQDSVKVSAQRGITLLEFVLATMVISVLVFVSLDRIIAVLEGDVELLRDIEEVTLHHSVNVMKTGLSIESGRAYATRQPDELEQWDGGNALTLIQSRDMFQGAFVDRLPGPGQWSYDAQLGHVVYDPAYLQSAEQDGVWRWRVAYESGGLVLQPVATAGLGGGAPE